MGKIWRQVRGFDGYEVSDCGEIRSKMGLLKSWTVKGYRRLCLWDGKKHYAYVHRLVAEAFIGEKPSDYHQINHKNFDRSDNRVENLEWVTCLENAQYSRVNGRKIGMQKLTEYDVRVIRTAYRCFCVPQRTIAKWFGLNHRNVGSIISGNTWGHVMEKGA